MFAVLKTKFNFQRFFIGEGPQQTPYLLTQRRVYILPTKQGLSFSVLLFIMLLGSINYSNSLGYFLTFLLASLVIVAIFHTYNNLLKLSFGTASCTPCFAGDSTSFSVQVNNRHHQARFSVQTYTANKLVTTTDLKANCLTAITIKHCFSQRGLVSLPRFTIESRFPFGLFRAWAILEINQKQWVYPKPSADKFLPVQLSGSSDGEKQINIGRDDFRGLRSYVQGDPLQHVHWKSFARHQALQTKEFSTSASNELWLNWTDTTATGTEHKLSQLCRWLLLADKQKLHYGLSLNGLLIKPNAGKKHLNQCLKQLALYDTTSADSNK